MNKYSELLNLKNLEKIQILTIRKIQKIINIEWTNNFKICQFLWGGQNLERQNVEQLIFRNFKITNIKMTKDIR